MLLAALTTSLSLCAPFHDTATDLFGYRACTDGPGLPATFMIADEFNACGIAAVLDEMGWRYIDRAGKPVIAPMIFDNGPDPFVEGLARYVEDEEYGYFDECGKIVIPAKYDFALPFEGGKAQAGYRCTFPPVPPAGEYHTYQCERWVDLVHPVNGAKAPN